MSTTIITALVIAVIIIAVIFLIRDIILRYFKINQLINLQKIIAETQLKIYEQNGGKVDWDKIKKAMKD